ncbi:MAG TPA: hypothetical protein VNJ47_00755 [Nevskiales bacterium]|nr:hypothetical protein [Nevskiales bacterium]
MALACLHGSLARAAPAAAALVGDWYNTDYGVYPEFAVLSLTADGRAAITGLDGRRRQGDYVLRPDGRLVIRMADDATPNLLRVIIDTVPRLQGERLELRARQRVFHLSRAPWLKAEVDKAIVRAREKARARPAPPQKAAATASKTRDTAPKPAPAIRAIWPRLSGDGAGTQGCGPPVMEHLHDAGWRLVDSPAQADAIADIELSGIEYERSIWVGRYYRINYRIRLTRARDAVLLGVEEGAERATGEGWFEACRDVAEEIAEELADLVEAAQED